MNVITKTKIKCPIAVELKIPEKELIELYDGCGVYTDWLGTSHTGNVKYCIGISFNDYDFEREGETWIYFQLDENESKTEGKFKISIPSANYNYEKSGDFEVGCVEDVKLCTTEEFCDPKNRYILNGKFTMKMEGCLMIEKEEKNNEAWKCRTSSDSLCLALWGQESKDFKIFVDKKEISAHKCVLSAHSPVFSRMFECGLKEAQENKVIIEDFPFEVVEAAIKLCYHHSLVSGTSLEDKMKILQFFDKYDIQELKENLETYLITVVDETNVCRLTNAALISNARKLEEKCSEFLQNCHRERKPIADYDLLDKDFALNLLKNAFYPVPNYESF